MVRSWHWDWSPIRGRDMGQAATRILSVASGGLRRLWSEEQQEIQDSFVETKT